MILRQSVLSTEMISVEVIFTVNGVPADPRGDAVTFAFKPPGQAPASGDWIAGSWDPDGPPYLAQIVTGPAPGAAAVLPGGVWSIWLKVTDNPEIPVRVTGQLIIW